MAISALHGRRPSRYSEIGAILHELSLINSNQAEVLRSMAGLRNVLVHMYARVDREKVLEFAKRFVRDAVELASMMVNGVKNRGV